MIFLIPLAIWLGTAICYMVFYKDMSQSFRRSILTSATGLFFFIAIVTEFLSAFDLITPTTITVAWGTLDLALSLVCRRLFQKGHMTLRQAGKNWWTSAREFLRKLGTVTQIALFSLLLITVTVAVVATPNNLDSLSYHLSRLGYWVGNSNVEHYPSHIERAISFSPFSEYVHLHTFLLAGSERYFQLLQWFCMVGILALVSMLTSYFSESDRPLRIAVCFALTLPIVVLESMTTQNDLVVSFFILATAFHVFDYVKTRRPLTLLLIALSCALGIMTKGTFVFYALPFGIFLFIFMVSRPDQWKNLGKLAGGVTITVLLLNAPFWYRTYEVFQTPIGRISSGNQNDISVPANLLSSISKHTFLHLGFVSPQNRYNEFMEKSLRSFHDVIGVPLNNPRTGMPFKMNKLNFNEDFAHNFLGMLLVLLTLPLLFFSKLTASARLYAALSFASFLLFCFFISYQTYGSRIHVPFFLLISPVIGLVYGALFSELVSRIFVVLLWLGALPFALLSVTHPLLSTKWFFEKIFPAINTTLHLNIHTENLLNLKQESIVYNSPEKIIWGDAWPEINQLKNQVETLGVKNIGFDFHEASYDYAYQYILRKPDRRFQHVAVRNPSNILETSDFYPDCIISEVNEGEQFSYHSITYLKKWSGTSRWLYVPSPLRPGVQ
jgi:hypothetical protein